MEGTNHSLFSDIPIVTISPEGIFKYILIRGQYTENNQQKTIEFIRGDEKLDYHAENFQAFGNELKAKGFEVKLRNIDSGKF